MAVKVAIAVVERLVGRGAGHGALCNTKQTDPLATASQVEISIKVPKARPIVKHERRILERERVFMLLVRSTNVDLKVHEMLVKLTKCTALKREAVVSE